MHIYLCLLYLKIMAHEFLQFQWKTAGVLLNLLCIVCVSLFLCSAHSRYPRHRRGVLSCLPPVDSGFPASPPAASASLADAHRSAAQTRVCVLCLLLPVCSRCERFADVQQRFDESVKVSSETVSPRAVWKPVCLEVTCPTSV